MYAGGSGDKVKHVEPSRSWTVSPSELREALSGLGKTAIKFELSEMHDAAEVRHPCDRLAQVQSPVGFWMPQ